MTSQSTHEADTGHDEMESARRLFRRGLYQKAAAVCENLLCAGPPRADLLELLGLASVELNQADRGIALLEHAVTLDPARTQAWLSLGRTLLERKRPAEAVRAYQAAASTRPPSLELLLGLAAAQQEAGDAPGAIECLRRAIDSEPRDIRALNCLGRALRSAGKAAESLETLKRAQSVSPDNAEMLAELGLTLTQLGRPDEALAPLRRAVRLKPRLAQAHYGLGRALVTQRDLAAALTHLRQALTLKPDLLEAHFVWASVLLQNGQVADAIDALRRCVQLKPNSADAHCNLGAALAAARFLPAAVASFEQALVVDPEHPLALRSKGRALITLTQRLPEALECLERALAHAADKASLGQLLHGYRSVCDWTAVRSTFQQLRALPDGVAQADPHLVLTVSDQPSEHLAAARAYAAEIAAARPPLAPPPRYRHDRIRVAYLSSDFYGHATSYLMAELFELHDRRKFQILAVSFAADDGSEVRKRIASASDAFIDATAKSDLQTALWLRAQEIDIAVDLKGYTGYARSGVFAYRPAPIQVNYLGYPGSMGAPFIDYLIADSFVVPEPERSFYSECIAYLPDSYQVNDRKRAVAEATPSRAQAGLPEDAFVFCCFNNNWKITEPVFDVWMRLISAVDGSVLWLLQDNPWAAARLREEAARRRVAPERLVFAERQPAERHLARQRLAHVFLDTLPCNAHTTASDALWMGLPVVTCAGRGFPARVAGSLLRAVGLSELITDTLEDYERLVLALARDPAKLRGIRARLARERTRLPLFDSPRYCRHLERAYHHMWELSQQGRAPEDFAVDRLE
ncbi:MAG TPA: tetratricopeptide repeat protein [Steroidobacteraceae bacterium]|nr:tetratricopeptide repeat protein [Steroidobacteraceae bacterium]